MSMSIKVVLETDFLACCPKLKLETAQFEMTYQLDESYIEYNNDYEFSGCDFSQIKEILANHDTTDDRIAKQIVRCLRNDGITWETLIDFDDKTLYQIINLWDLSRVTQRPAIIHGLIIRGIKQLQNMKEIKRGTFSMPPVSEKELEMRDKLSRLSKLVTDSKRKFENESKEKENMKDGLYHEYKNTITNTINEMIEQLKEYERTLIVQLDSIFDKHTKKQEKYLSSLNLMSKQIDLTTNTYDQSFVKCRKMSDINQRKIDNCEMIENTIRLYKKAFDIESNNNDDINSNWLIDNDSSSYKCEIIVSKKYSEQMKYCMSKLIEINNIGALKTEIIDKPEVLYETKEFDILIKNY